MKRSILAIIIILSVFNYIKLNAQPIESPIEPIYYKYHDFELRGIIGLGVNYNSGSYWAECPECQFESLSGFGFTIGPEPEYAILPNYLYVGMKVLYDVQNMSGSFRRIESVPLKLADNSEISTPIEFRHTLDLSMQAISFSPNIFFRIADMFDIRLGFYGDFLISTNVKHIKELLTHSTILPNGERVIVSLADMPGNTATLEDREIPGAKSMVFGISPEVNFNILLSKEWEFVMGTYFKIPLTSISDNQSDFKTNMWRFYLGVSYNLNTKK
jgi:hypothetical protein